VPIVVLQCHIKETTPLHVAISHKMSCEFTYVVLEEIFHHMLRHHAVEENEDNHSVLVVILASPDKKLLERSP